MCPVWLRQLLGQLKAAGAQHGSALEAAVMEQNDSDDESVTPTLPGFVRASKPPAPPGFVRPASRPKKKTSGADVAAAYRAAVRRPKVNAPAPSVAVGPARMATCAACGATYDPLAREAHEASIAHQLAVGPRTRGRRVMLPEGNPGAKILERMGWSDDGERPGIGAPGREGRIQPLAVALKRDTSGLGSRAYENRVSHFSANDAAAVAPPRPPKPPPPPPPSRKARRRAEAEDRRRSVRLRRDLADAIPEGYEELFR